MTPRKETFPLIPFFIPSLLFLHYLTNTAGKDPEAEKGCRIGTWRWFKECYTHQKYIREIYLRFLQEISFIIMFWLTPEQLSLGEKKAVLLLKIICFPKPLTQHRVTLWAWSVSQESSGQKASNILNGVTDHCRTHTKGNWETPAQLKYFWLWEETGAPRRDIHRQRQDMLIPHTKPRTNIKPTTLEMWGQHANI